MMDKQLLTILLSKIVHNLIFVNCVNDEKSLTVSSFEMGFLKDFILVRRPTQLFCIYSLLAL